MMVIHASAELLLPLVLLLPLAGALLVACLARVNRRVASLVVMLAAGLTLAGVMALVPEVLSAGRLSWSMPGLAGRLELAADAFSLIFALVGAFVWFCASVYAAAYLRDDPARERFQLVSLVVLSANLGVVLAGDLMTLFVCFELLGLVALLLILHDGSDRARRAGVKYFWMTLTGGFALLAGIVLIHTLAGSGALAPLPGDAGPPAMVWAAFLLMLIGFGVKAGMVPLHTWLPDAHPAAPVPASALLSGVMIKAGAYGVFRLLNTLFRPEIGADFDLPGWELNARFGLLIVWLGIVTMLVGVTLALGQHHAKRMLAWHSVSQMGFVLTGLGAGAWLGAEGGMGTAGGLMHMANHALFKAGLFLGMGAVAMYAGTADMYRLGGLWRRMPVVLACMIVFAAGITGVPLFNGFVSKCMIHHALVDGAALPGGRSLIMAEWLYIVTCAGTVASFVKLIGLVFIARPASDSDEVKGHVRAGLLVPMLLLTVPVVVLGVQPAILLLGLIVPGLESLALPGSPVAYYLSNYFLGRADLLAFSGMLAGGVALFVIGMRWGLFSLAAPDWVGVDYWYRRLAAGFVRTCNIGGRHAAAMRARMGTMAWQVLVRLDRLPDRSRTMSAWLIQAVARAGARVNRLLDRPGHLLGRLSVHLSTTSGWRTVQDVRYRELDRNRDELIEKVMREVNRRDQRRVTACKARLEQRLNATRQVAGLVASQQLEQAMADDVDDAGNGLTIETGSASVDAIVDATEAWLDGQALQEALASAGIDLPGRSEEDIAPSDPAHWWPELRALLFRPGMTHWPVTEHADRSALAAMLRRLFEHGTRDPGSGLLVAALLILLLGALFGVTLLVPESPW